MLGNRLLGLGGLGGSRLGDQAVVDTNDDAQLSKLCVAGAGGGERAPAPPPPPPPPCCKPCRRSPALHPPCWPPHPRSSCVRHGYFQDEFVHHFVRRPARRSPLINRGAAAAVARARL